MHKQNLTIPKSLKKQLLVITGSTVFVIIGYFMVFHGVKPTSLSPFIVKLFGVIAILFFGGIGVLMVIEFLRFRPAINLNSLGIQNYSHAGGGYTVTWVNIKVMKIKKVGNNRFIIIDLHDPDEIYSQVNIFTRWWMKLNEKQYGSPVFIPSILIKTKLEDVLQQIREFKKQLNNNG